MRTNISHLHAIILSSALPALGLVAAVALGAPAQAIEITTHAKAGNVFSSTGDENYGPATGTASTAQANYSGSPGLAATATAKARLDVATGELGVSAATSGYGSASSEARFVEQLAFTVAGAAADDLTPITILLNWHGSLSGGAWTDYGFSLTRDNGTNAILQLDARSPNGSTQYNTQIAGDWVNSSIQGQNTGNQVFTFTFNLKGASSALTLATSMRETAIFDAMVNVYHTARINFILPSNVSYMSGSGTFLSNATAINAVPEMETWGMMLIGFGVMGYAMRRRRAPKSDGVSVRT